MPVKVPDKPTKRQRKAMVEAQAFAKFGIHVLRVKAKVLAELGKEADDGGIKHLGNGQVIVASGYAEDAIGRLGGVVDKLASEEKPNFELIVEVMRLQKEFNQQLITTAQIHLNIAKSIPSETQHQILHSFPAGAPVMIAVGKTQQQA